MMKKGKDFIIFMMGLFSFSLCCCGSNTEIKSNVANKPADTTERNDGIKAKKEHMEEEQEEQEEKGELFTLYNLSQTYSIEEIIERFSIGYSAENDHSIRGYVGDIGGLVDAYMDMDLNGDGTADSVKRAIDGSSDEDLLQVSYSINIENGPATNTDDLSEMMYDMGDVFEFKDINNDGIDEVLITKYSSSTKDYFVDEVSLYYIYKDDWKHYDFTEDIDHIAGAELTDDGVCLLVDYAGKWCSCFDVFCYEIGEDGSIHCKGNDSSYAEKYWPIKYSYSFSVADFLTEEEKEAASDLMREIYTTGLLPDGTDISEQIGDAENDNSTLVFTMIDLGVDNELGINIRTWANDDSDNDSSKDEIEVTYAYNIDDKEACVISDKNAYCTIGGGFRVTASDDYSEYQLWKYDPVSRSYESVCVSDSLDSEEMKKAIGDNEITLDFPSFYLGRNIKIYKELNSGLQLIDNGKGNRKQSEMVNFYY